jgi:hypothetical protein
MDNGIWLTINEYANYRSISVSTIRRYIKAGRIKYKFEDGKYLIFVSHEQYELRKNQTKQDNEVIDYKVKIDEMDYMIKKLKEENTELKMLVNLYEKGAILKNSTEQLPDLPLSQ